MCTIGLHFFPKFYLHELFSHLLLWVEKAARIIDYSVGGVYRVSRVDVCVLLRVCVRMRVFVCVCVYGCVLMPAFIPCILLTVLPPSQ